MKHRQRIWFWERETNISFVIWYNNILTFNKSIPLINNHQYSIFLKKSRGVIIASFADILQSHLIQKKT